MTEPLVLNPAAIYKSISEQYNYALATGNHDPAVYEGLQAQMNRWVARWQSEAMIPGPAQETNLPFIESGTSLSLRLGKSLQSANLGAYGAARDTYIAAGGIDRSLLDDELDNLVQDGMSLEEAANFMMATGRYDLAEIARYTYQVGGPMDPAGPSYNPGDKTDHSGGIPGPGNGGGSKRFEQVPDDFTDPKSEFQAGFSRFTRQLETSQHGRAPNIGALNARYTDLFNSYQGAMEAGKADGSQPANMWKEEFVNVGKSTDPQFDQTGDRFQQRTVRPNISAFDWILKNVDPEDVYASTAPRDRPGEQSTTGGFRGYVTRRGG